MPGAMSKVTRHCQITIPKYIRKITGIHEGDMVDINVSKSGEIIVTPVKMIKKEQAYYWTDKWQQEVKESEEAIKEGDFEIFENIDKAKKSLHNE